MVVASLLQRRRVSKNRTLCYDEGENDWQWSWASLLFFLFFLWSILLDGMMPRCGFVCIFVYLVCMINWFGICFSYNIFFSFFYFSVSKSMRCVFLMEVLMRGNLWEILGIPDVFSVGSVFWVFYDFRFFEKGVVEGGGHNLFKTEFLENKMIFFFRVDFYAETFHCILNFDYSQ